MTPPAGRPHLSDALRAAYERAIYRVDASPAPFVLRVGEASAELDRCLAAAGAVRCALLSAANPGSSPLPESENLRRHRRLVALVRRDGYRSLFGENFDEATGGWREKSLLILGISPDAAITLAREFGQAALLMAERGGAVRLLATPP